MITTSFSTFLPLLIIVLPPLRTGSFGSSSGLPGIECRKLPQPPFLREANRFTGQQTTFVSTAFACAGQLGLQAGDGVLKCAALRGDRYPGASIAPSFLHVAFGTGHHWIKELSHASYYASRR